MTRAGLRSMVRADGGGVGPKLARMWQSGAPGEGGSQVEAPVLIFEQAQKRLTAHGAGGGAPMAVHTVLVSAPRKDGVQGAPKKTGASGVRGVGMTRSRRWFG